MYRIEEVNNKQQHNTDYDDIDDDHDDDKDKEFEFWLLTEKENQRSGSSLQNKKL